MLLGSVGLVDEYLRLMSGVPPLPGVAGGIGMSDNCESGGHANSVVQGGII